MKTTKQKINAFFGAGLLLTSSLVGVFTNSTTHAQEKQSTGKFGKVRLVADQWCPHNCDPKSNMPGIQVEVAQRAFGKANVVYSNAPWARAIEETRGNATSAPIYDGIIGANANDAPDFVSSDTLGKSMNCFYRKKGSNWSYKGHNSINGKKIGAIGSYSYNEFINDYILKHKGTKFVTLKNGEDALVNLLRMLGEGNIELVPDDESVLLYTLAQHPEINKKVELAGCATNKGDYSYIGISFSPFNKQKSQELVAVLNETIAKMKANGDMDKLLAKYKAKKWW